MQKELICSIIFHDFPRVVKLSESRRAKYFKPTDKLASKYLLKDVMVVDPSSTNSTIALDNKGRYRLLKGEYVWRDHKLSTKKIERRLYNRETSEYIIKNPSVAGTPNIETINGQKMYNGLYHPHTRDKIMDVIHNYMKGEILRQNIQPIKKYPLIIDGYMYDYGKECPISKGKYWDVGNRSFPYNKGFEDVLQELKILNEDNFDHIIGPPRVIFRNLDKGWLPLWDHIPILDPNDPNKFMRQLVYKIYTYS